MRPSSWLSHEDRSTSSRWDRAVFHLLASNTRKHDEVGQMVEDWSGEIEEVATMDTELPTTDEEARGTTLPVWLESRVTEIGTLELWSVSRDDPERRW